MTEHEIQQLQHLTKQQLIAMIVRQAEIVKVLEGRITALEKDSTNSSKPPSTDFVAKRTQSLRQKSGKPSGGQSGHGGTTHLQAALPDKIKVCRPERCERCGDNLTDTPGTITCKRQEADIPPITVHVTEYQQETVACRRCGHTTKGMLPERITAPFQIGHTLKAVIVYLNIAHHIPFERCTEILHDLLSARLSEGTVDRTLTEAYERARTLTVEILTDIKKERWVGSDETGTHVAGEKWWQWTWQNRRGSYYAIEPGRGYAVVRDHFGEDYQGTLVSDCWSAQNNTHAGAHQHCHPHYLRDLQFCIDTERSAWAYETFRFLIASERARDIVWASDFDMVLRDRVIASYEARLRALTNALVAGRESRKIQKRLRKHYEKILYFMNSPDIPFHNNSSEQAIRNAKLHKKISGGFRSTQGARRHAALLSVIETCKKRKIDILTSLKLLFQGQLSFQGT